MLQEVIVYIIIASALVYSVYKLVKSVTNKTPSACEGCTGCGIKHEMIKKGNTTTHDCSYQSIKKS